MKLDFDVQLKWSNAVAVSTTDAWLIASDSIDRWVAELNRIEGVKEHIAIYYLPRSRRDHSAGSLFVVGNLPPLPITPWVQPYRRLGGVLYIPCDAGLNAPLQDFEIDRLLPFHLAVFHPHLGLIGFEEGDAHAFFQLVAGPEEKPTGFSSAHPGYPLQERLFAITPAEPPRMELIFEAERGEIGTRSSAELPPLEDEPKDGKIRDVRRYIHRRMLEGILRLTEFAPEGGTHPTWLSRTREWADEQLKNLQDRQKRELQRLIHLLRTNPDEGLRYALPLSNERNRGLAPPSGKLTPKKSIDFSLAHLQGGHSASPWMIDWKDRMELSQQYRDAANRELRLGRHRRAAYIFAELLNEPREAANVLRQGGHYREAAVLYLKQLNAPLEAAHCLVEGGFLKEALPLYEEKQQYELAASIYRHMGDHAAAEKMYRQAVARHLSHQHHVLAAKILEDELSSLEEAIAVLQSSWPDRGDSMTCLRYELDVYAKHSMKERAVLRIDEVAQGFLGNRVVQFLQLLSDLSKTYSDPRVRGRARDMGFLTASRSLAQEDFPQRRDILNLLHGLAPNDRLLLRDAQRYQQLEAERRRQLEREKQNPIGNKPLDRVDSHELPSDVHWTHFISRGRAGFYGIGRSGNGSIVMRQDWRGHFQRTTLPHPLPAHIHLAAAHDSHPEILSILGMTELQTVMGPVDFFPQALRIENPTWSKTEGFLGMCFSPGGVAWVLHRSHEMELILLSFSKMGDLIATRGLPLPDTIALDPSALTSPLCMVCARDQIFIAIDQHLIRFHRDQSSVASFNSFIRGLTPSASYARLRIGVTFEFGAELCWADSEWGLQHPLPLHLERPQLAFTPTGNLLVASPHRLDVLENTQRGYVPLCTQEIESMAVPMGVYPTEEHQVFAVLTSDTVTRYRVGR